MLTPMLSGLQLFALFPIFLFLVWLAAKFVEAPKIFIPAVFFVWIFTTGLIGTEIWTSYIENPSDRHGKTVLDICGFRESYPMGPVKNPRP